MKRHLAALASNFETIAYRQTDEGTAWVTLSREEAANSRNQQMREELASLWSAIAESEVRAVVLTGAGDRFFCAGMDLTESQQRETAEARRRRLRSSTDIEQLAILPQPTIAAINGYAVGGGLEMALACDLRLMAADAKVGLPEVNHGLIPGRGGTQRLPRLIGMTRAFEMLYLGEMLGAQKALDIGLVNHVLPARELGTRADDVAERLARGHRPAVQAIKRSVLRGRELPLADAISQELEELLLLMEGNSREPVAPTSKHDARL